MLNPTEFWRFDVAFPMRDSCHCAKKLEEMFTVIKARDEEVRIGAARGVSSGSVTIGQNK